MLLFCSILCFDRFLVPFCTQATYRHAHSESVNRSVFVCACLYPQRPAVGGSQLHMNASCSNISCILLHLSPPVGVLFVGVVAIFFAFCSFCSTFWPTCLPLKGVPPNIICTWSCACLQLSRLVSPCLAFLRTCLHLSPSVSYLFSTWSIFHIWILFLLFVISSACPPLQRWGSSISFRNSKSWQGEQASCLLKGRKGSFEQHDFYPIPSLVFQLSPVAEVLFQFDWLHSIMIPLASICHPAMFHLSPDICLTSSYVFIRHPPSS